MCLLLVNYFWNGDSVLQDLHNWLLSLNTNRNICFVLERFVARIIRPYPKSNQNRDLYATIILYGLYLKDSGYYVR